MHKMDLTIKNAKRTIWEPCHPFDFLAEITKESYAS